jgi:MFS family permease
LILIAAALVFVATNFETQILTNAAQLCVAAFMLGGGTLGDIYGRKRFLMYGLIGIIITSVLAFLA